jgi:glycosyltransferase involved in cell wall biosynthesis
VDQKKIIITAVQVPFTRGGAEILVDLLKEALVKRGFLVDIVQIPFAPQKENLAKNIKLWTALDEHQLGDKADLIIGTKFPSYLIDHPKVSLWLIHQHRPMYDLFGTRFSDFHADSTSEALRRSVMTLEKEALDKISARYTISTNVSKRLETYLDVPSKVLTPPLPRGDRYWKGESKPYVLVVGRICAIKRVDLMVRAMTGVHADIKLKIVGSPDESTYIDHLQAVISQHHLESRIEFLGRVSDEELLDLYAHAHSVFYAPVDEDYGFVTLEALASGKPVITGTDSGGTLEFVQHGRTGMVVQPEPHFVAEAVNELYQNTELYSQITNQAQASFQTSTWDEIVHSLTAPIRDKL